MHYFLKRCGFQELGSVGEDGKAKRGRYLMTSNNEEVIDFFQSLSIEIANDTALLSVIPLYNRMRTYCSYVYHNSKYTGTEAKHPRNERRIYLNSEIENHQLYFRAEDILVMRKSDSYTISPEGEEQEFYYVDLVKNHSSGLYMRLSKIIENYPIVGGYGIYDGELEFFEEQVKEFERGQVLTDVVIDKSVTDRISKASEENKANVFNPATFRDFVLAGYGNACAITGQPADGIFGVGVDVVYIKPRAEGGDCNPSNGIALSKDLSLAFIQGKFTLSDNCEVLIHPDNDDLLVQQYQLKQIRIPPNKFFEPNKSNIIFHRENIFGLFKKM